MPRARPCPTPTLQMQDEASPCSPPQRRSAWEYYGGPDDAAASRVSDRSCPGTCAPEHARWSGSPDPQHGCGPQHLGRGEHAWRGSPPPHDHDSHPVDTTRTTQCDSHPGGPVPRCSPDITPTIPGRGPSPPPHPPERRCEPARRRLYGARTAPPECCSPGPAHAVRDSRDLRPRSPSHRRRPRSR